MIGELHSVDVDDALCATMHDMSETLLARGDSKRQWNTHGGWEVYIGAGTTLQQRVCKTPGGFLHAISEWHDDRLVHATIAGDFLCYLPGGVGKLESVLADTRADQIGSKVGDFYREFGWVTPGIQPKHWVQVLSPFSLEREPV